MTRDDLERQLLDLWVKTRIPLTRAHIQYATGASRRALDRWLDELVMEGVLELDLGTANELEYKVPGAERPPAGASTFDEWQKTQKKPASGRARKPDLGDDLMGKAVSLARSAGDALRQPTEPGKKNLAVSAGLSLFGPLGWLYAGDLREAIPAAVVSLILYKILPSFLMFPLLLVGIPLSVLAGLIYAWSYNREGKRSPMFLAEKSEPPT